MFRVNVRVFENVNFGERFGESNFYQEIREFQFPNRPQKFFRIVEALIFNTIDQKKGENNLNVSSGKKLQKTWINLIKFSPLIKEIRRL